MLHYLLKGAQPIIVVLARGLYKRITFIFKDAISENRLLIITEFDKGYTRVNKFSSEKRNQLILSLCNEVFIPFISTDGSINKLINKESIMKRDIFSFNIKQNQHLLKKGIKLI